MEMLTFTQRKQLEMGRFLRFRLSLKRKALCRVSCQTQPRKHKSLAGKWVVFSQEGLPYGNAYTRSQKAARHWSLYRFA